MKEHILNQKTVGKRILSLSENDNNINVLLRLIYPGFTNLMELHETTVKPG